MLHRVNGTWVGSGSVEDTTVLVLSPESFATVQTSVTGGTAVYSDNTQWGVNGKWLNGSWLNSGYSEARPELAFGSTARVYTDPFGVPGPNEVASGGANVPPIEVAIEADGDPTGGATPQVAVDQEGSGFTKAGGYTDVIPVPFGEKWLGSGSVLGVDVLAAGDAVTTDGSDTTILARCAAAGTVPDGSSFTADVQFIAAPTVPDGSEVTTYVDEDGAGTALGAGDTSIEVGIEADGLVPDGSDTVAVAVSTDGDGFVLDGSLSDVDIIAVGGPAYIRGEGETTVNTEFLVLRLFTRWVPVTGARMIYVTPKNRVIPVSPDGRVMHVIGSGTNQLTDPEEGA